jgi:hypothetical protein
MTGANRTEPHDRPQCGARKRQPAYPGETCARPAGWGTEHAGYGKCKLHGGATPYRHGRYSRVVHELLLPSIRSKMRRYYATELVTALRGLVADAARRDELLTLVLAEAGLDDGIDEMAEARGAG